MVEIAIWPSLAEITCERTLSGVIRVNLGPQHTPKEVLFKMVTSGFDSLAKEAVELFANDDFPRTFEQTPEFLLVRRA